MKYWLGVVSKNHVMIGVEGKFAQVCHGKSGPLKRLKKDDWLVYYSPKQAMNSDIPVQEFTAIGQVSDDEVFEFAMNDSFKPFRRKMDYWANARALKIADVKSMLHLTAEPNWGYQLRLGLLELSDHDFDIIYERMKI